MTTLTRWRRGAPILHPEAGDTNILPEDTVGGADVFVDKGDVDQGLADADVVVDATTTYHNATQNSLDNWNCLIEWNPEGITVWSNSYEAHQTRMHISEMLDVPLNTVRVVSPYVGGQFGRGDTGDQPFFLFTALLAKRTGRPVWFRHSRRESFHDGRQHVCYEGTIGAKRDGTITALSFKSVGNVGAYADHSMFALKFAPVEATEVAFAHIPNVRFEGRGVYTNKMPACMIRGVGNSQLNLILGRLVDGLAEALNIDPIDLACKNFGHEWEELPDRSLTEVLRTGAARISWKEKRHLPGEGPVVDGVKRRGVGFSFHPGWHAEWQELRRGEVHVTMTVNADCSVTLDAPTVETGTGSNTCNVLGCAEALSFLGISSSDIHWISTVDTDASPQDCVQTDSSVSFLQSEVMAAASKEVKAKLLERVAPLLGATPPELDIDAGFVYRKDATGSRRSLRELLFEASLDPITVAVSRRPLGVRTGIPFIATFAEVEVDTDTGQVLVLRLVVVNDCGTVMYASGAEAQQIGGQCMALGESLTEEIIYDERTGYPLELQLDRLPDPDDGRHAGDRSGLVGGVARGRRIRSVRHRRGDRHLHAPRRPQRCLQRHRCQDRQYSGQAGGCPQGSREDRLMTLPPFAHVTVGSLEEAAVALGGEKARVIAGGTDLLGTLKDRVHPEHPSAPDRHQAMLWREPCELRTRQVFESEL